MGVLVEEWGCLQRVFVMVSMSAGCVVCRPAQLCQVKRRVTITISCMGETLQHDMLCTTLHYGLLYSGFDVVRRVGVSGKDGRAEADRTPPPTSL